MKKTAIISFALLMAVAATSANAQYQRKMETVVEQPDFHKSPEREHIQSDLFQPIYGVKRLPLAVRDYLDEMANPGEGWQEGCVQITPPVPGKRLIFAAVSDDHLIVYYETGGYSHDLRFDIFSFKQDFSFDSKSFDTPALNPYYHAPRCFVWDWGTTVVRAKDVIHRGSGYTSKRLESIEELKTAILASRAE